MPTGLDKYRIHRLVARGGMADVLLASPRDNVSHETMFAIKRVRTEFADDPTFVRMLLDEVLIMRYLVHPNIARLLDWGMSDGAPFIVMEFVAGIDLAPMVKRKPLPEHLILEIGASVARALDTAHYQRDESGELLDIVHRDVTPQNVMITFDGKVKLLDFGIATARVRAEKTRTGILKGKWPYISPEQVIGKQLDGRSDIFSLGALLYEMCTSQRAFQGESPADTLSAVAFRQPVPVRQVNPDISEQLTKIIEHCLMKSRSDRYSRGLYVAEALEHELQRQPRRSQDVTLQTYLSQLFPGRSEQINAVLDELVATYQNRDDQLTPFSQVVIKPVPFMRKAADIDDDDSLTEVTHFTPVEHQRPSVPPSDIPGDNVAIDNRPTVPSPPSNSVSLLLAVVVLGLVLGFGVVMAFWLLAPMR